MSKTKIEWCDYTINPVKGLCPMTCSYCYARRMYKRFKWNSEIRFDYDFLDWKPPTESKVFIGSTIELFGGWIKPDWMARILAWCKQNYECTFIFLTKQPQNLIKWSPFPNNCWVGVSATNESMLDSAFLWLLNTEARVKFISFEPLLEHVRLEVADLILAPKINWLIIGQQTPPSKKTEPKIEWIREIVEAANKAKIPVFLKDNLLELVNYDSPETDFAFNKEGYYRQEFPTEAQQK